jgi:PAS domain S-box-containing protein
VELRESEEKYRLVVENGYNAIYIYRDRRILFANRQVTSLTGYTNDELLEMNIWDLVHPDDRARMQESGKRRISGHSLPPNFTGRIIKKSGEVAECEFFVNRILYQNQPALLGITGDITEQKKAENALRESEEKYRTIVETSPNMIWEVDLQGKFRYISPMVQKIMGYTPEEMIGRSVTDLVSEHRRSFAMKEFSKFISCEGPSLPIEVPARHRNGSELILEIRPARMIGPDGNLIGFHGVAVDITDRKRSEEAFRRENPR